MQKIATLELEQELKLLDPRIIIAPNQNRPGASNVFLNGVDICTWVPSEYVQDEATPDYVYRLNDLTIPFKTSGEIKEIVQMVLEKAKDPEIAKELFDTTYAIPDATQYK
jgi:hypothetical protein